MSSTEAVIKKLVIEGLGVSPEIASSNELMSNKILDSFERMHLIDLLEERFNIKILSEYLTTENFGSTRSLARLIERLLARSFCSESESSKLDDE